MNQSVQVISTTKVKIKLRICCSINHAVWATCFGMPLALYGISGCRYGLKHYLIGVSNQEKSHSKT